MRILLVLLTFVFTSACFAADGKSLCHLTYEMYEETDPAKEYAVIFYYELSKPVVKDGKWTRETLHQLDCEDLEKKADMMKAIKKDCSGLNAGGITFAPDSYFNQACG